MRILIISQFYAPDVTAAAFRISETVSCLVEQGHDVRVITAYPHKGLARNSKNSNLLSERHVYRTKVTEVGQGGLVAYVKSYLSFVLGGLWQGRRLLLSSWRPDVVWTTSPPLFTSLCGLVFSRLFNCPLIFDVRDIWPDSAVAAEQMSATGIAYKIGKVFELKSYGWALHITAVSQPMAEYIRSQSRTPVTVIYNGILSSFEKINTPFIVKKRIMYAGNLGRVQGLEVLIKAFDELTKEGITLNWEVVMVGAGALQGMLEKMICERRLGSKIHILPPMTKESVMQEMANSALLFLNLKGDEVFKLTVPSKVFDYMAVGRPIIGGILGEGKKLLETTGANLCFDPSNKESLKFALIKALEHLPELASKAARNIELISREYKRETITRALVSVFESARRR